MEIYISDEDSAYEDDGQEIEVYQDDSFIEMTVKKELIVDIILEAENGEIMSNKVTITFVDGKYNAMKMYEWYKKYINFY